MSDEEVRPQDVPEGAITEENLVENQPQPSQAKVEEEARRAKVREVEERQRQRKPDEADEADDE